MSLGPLMVGVKGLELLPEEREMLRHPRVGGVILFRRNFSGVEQLRALVEAIHALRRPPLLVAVDHEGGRVQRFREGFTELPPARCYGHLHDRDPRLGRKVARQAGWLMAAELRAAGIDFSFAPVLDLDRGRSAVIGDRALHAHPEVVAVLGAAFMRGMGEAGMAAVAKHFPGHGAVAADTHLEQARDPRPYADIELEDMLPFARLIERGLAGVMPAHVVYPALDERPAGFSPFWLGEVLRGRLGFQGAIFSDDLLMAGAAPAGEVADRVEAALEAGCDMALVCDDFGAICSALDRLARFDTPVAHLRLARLHGRGRWSRAALHNDRRWREALDAIALCEADREQDLL